MTNRSEGSKYVATKNLRDTEIAKLIRGDIKAAIAAGDLPKGLKCSVRTSGSSTHSAIDITVTAVPAGFLYWTEAFLVHDLMHPHVCFDGDRTTEEAQAIVRKLEQIHGAYNFDNSDSQTDYFHVRYYGGANFSWKLTGAERDARRNAIKGEAPARAAAARAVADEATQIVAALEARRVELEAKVAASRPLEAIQAELASKTAAYAFSIQLALAESSLASGRVHGHC
jgi:hypothetical protein